MDRRRFLETLAAVSFAGGAHGLLGEAVRSKGAKKNLVPEKPSGAPNYWCTWAVQNYQFGQGARSISTKVLEGDSGAQLAHNVMSEETLLGTRGWAYRFHQRIRQDLFLLLDDGWETGGTATFELDPVKFPGFKGTSKDRLERLNQAIEGLGWRGAALWCRNTPGGAADFELENQCSAAGIRYWKIDIGDRDFNLVRKRNEAGIPLTLEHVHGEMPVNGDWAQDGRFGLQAWDSRRMEILRNTDVYRTYDVTSILSLPTTLDRAAEMLKTAAGHGEVRGLLNVEDEVYVAAVLGCTMGVMRHPQHGLRPDGDPDLFFNGPRRAKQRMDEVVRAVRWQRIAQPFAAGIGSFKCSPVVLRDGWTFSPGETWQQELIGRTVWQAAPAVMARNIDLPEVSGGEEKPFVFAARFPNGAVALGIQERTQPSRGWYLPRCTVELNVGDASGPIGIFGECQRLTLEFSAAQTGKRVLAQDLSASEAVDITALAQVKGNKINFDGEVLRRIGLSHGTPGDLSSPGMVVAIE
jgi:hypothetical protein